MGSFPAVFSGGSLSNATAGMKVSFIHRSMSVGLLNLFRRPCVVGQALMISTTERPLCCTASMMSLSSPAAW